MTRDKAIEEVKNYENYPNGLSKECRDYIIKALEQETVSKESYDHEYFLRKELEMKIAKLEQQEPRKGYWIEHSHEAGANWELSMYECSECHAWEEDDSNYCPNCGCAMVEPQESEEQTE